MSLVPSVIALASMSVVPLGNAGNGTETFALIVGVNRSVDAQVSDLHYADDDAIEFDRVFRLFGATTHVLVAPDENTTRLYGTQASFSPPSFDALVRAAVRIRGEVAAARGKGRATRFFFVYAGHGAIQEDRGYVSLSDRRLWGQDIAHRVVAVAGADQAHLIVDACHSFFLAHARGPGGKREPARGFSVFQELPGFENVGLLLSTSSANESHEWDGIQAGVFAYEVRSALYGAADADGDTVIRYDEVAAFVEHANAAIQNERFRPMVFARKPADSDVLIDGGFLDRRRVIIDGKNAAHYRAEDALGVRLFDVHNAPSHEAALLLPENRGPIFIRTIPEEFEYEATPPLRPTTLLAELRRTKARERTRGAAHQAFGQLFSLPFADETVARYAAREHVLPSQLFDAQLSPDDGRAPSWLVFGLFGLGAVSLGTSLGFRLQADGFRQDALAASTHAVVADLNGGIRRDNVLSGTLLGVGVASLATASLLWLWPRHEPSEPPEMVP